jgi:hypothetical protein
MKAALLLAAWLLLTSWAAECDRRDAQRAQGYATASVAAVYGSAAARALYGGNE